MVRRSGKGPPRFAFGCLAVVILAVMVGAGMAVIFLWDVNAR